jgi:tRNA (mo5U34)-methyltransferase
VDIAALVKEARRFAERIRRVKQSLGDPGFEWYPYDTLSALGHLEKLLTGANRGLVDGRGRVLDMGSQDGELAFFLESLGYQVVAVDHPAYNHNGMRGIRALKAALGSAVEIHELDADRPFTLPHDTYDLVFFLGILYHLRGTQPGQQQLLHFFRARVAGIAGPRTLGDPRLCEPGRYLAERPGASRPRRACLLPAGEPP